MPPFLRRFLTFIIIVSYIGTTFTPTYGVLPPLKLTDEAEKSKAALTAKFDAGTSASSAEKLSFPTKAGKIISTFPWWMAGAK
jgi:hypothetical protein